MINLQVSRDEEQGAFVIRGDFDPKAVAISIPKDNPHRGALIDFFLHKSDLEFCINYLCCISLDKPQIINEALYIAALNGCLKCFKPSSARKKLDRDDLFDGDINAIEELKYFETLRDRHFMHDENCMIQATDFLLLNPASNLKKLEQACVVWNKAAIDYYAEAERLKNFASFIHQRTCVMIDIVGQKIIDAYNTLSHEELMNFGNPQTTLASTKDISQKRSRT